MDLAFTYYHLASTYVDRYLEKLVVGFADGVPVMMW